jgi:glycosyltransferase involved in cell wall biosynthesis
MDNTLKLSSIIIARDEEHNIRRCIQSQVDVIDEIIVIIDSRTKDSTFEVVSSFGNVLCEKVEWKGFAGTKTYALSKTSNDWVLWIDADEEITPNLAKELKSFKKQMPQFNSYNLARRAFFLGKWIKHSGWYPARVTRLFNKQFVSFNDNRVHEGLKITGSIGVLENDLNHYTDPSIDHYFIKYNSYTSLAAQELFVKGKSASLSDIIIRPVFIFLKMFIFRLGFMDGLHGLILAVFSSSYVFTKYCKLWELNKKK